MTTQTLTIIPFQPDYQLDVDIMMDEIAAEFESPIFSRTGPKVNESEPISKRVLWVALLNGIVVGTIGVYHAQSGYGVLKSLFVAKEHRSTKLRVADQLLDTLLNYARENNLKEIYFGTMLQFKAAQRFYAKNGFTQISEIELPKDYPGNDLDSIFYHKIIA